MVNSGEGNSRKNTDFPLIKTGATYESSLRLRLVGNGHIQYRAIWNLCVKLPQAKAETRMALDGCVRCLPCRPVYRDVWLPTDYLFTYLVSR